jgi:RimJ/RimL family protein N-acetyltransferase
MRPLLTKRLIVRRLTSDDLADFCAYHADPRVREFQPGDAMSTEQAVSFLAAQSVIDERETGSWHGYAVEHAESGIMIGDIGIFLASDVEGDVGFQFHPEYHRRGYGYEAMSGFLAYVFATLGVDRITAGCDPANDASRALLARLGMRQRKPVGAEVDCRYDLTRAEWSARD